MMYGQMTAGSGSTSARQGIVQGTYETFAEAGRQHFGGDLAGKLDPDRRPRRHGRRAAAGGDLGRRASARDRVPAEPHRLPPARRATSTSARDRSTRRSTIIADTRTASRSRSACSAMRPRSCRSWCGAAIAPDAAAPTRPRRTIWSTATCRPAGRVDAGRRCARRDPEAVDAGRARVDGASTSRRCSTSRRWACRPSTTATTSARSRMDEGVANAFDFPGLRAGLHPAAVLPRHRPVPLGRAVGRSGGHLPDRREGEGAVSRRPAPAPLARHGARAHRLPGPAGAHLLGRPRRAPPAGLAFNEMVRSGELKAPIVIGRDHLDSGSVASPNRETESDAGRQRRRLRLAAAQRPAQHRRRRDLGVAPPWRRRRHGLFAACRHGDRVRRHRRRRRGGSSACCGTTPAPA